MLQVCDLEGERFLREAVLSDGAGPLHPGWGRPLPHPVFNPMLWAVGLLASGTGRLGQAVAIASVSRCWGVGLIAGSLCTGARGGRGRQS